MGRLYALMPVHMQVAISASSASQAGMDMSDVKPTPSDSGAAQQTTAKAGAVQRCEQCVNTHL